MRFGQAANRPRQPSRRPLQNMERCQEGPPLSPNSRGSSRRSSRVTAVATDRTTAITPIIVRPVPRYWIRPTINPTPEHKPTTIPKTATPGDTVTVFPQAIQVNRPPMYLYPRRASPFATVWAAVSCDSGLVRSHHRLSNVYRVQRPGAARSAATRGSAAFLCVRARLPYASTAPPRPVRSTR